MSGLHETGLPEQCEQSHEEALEIVVTIDLRFRVQRDLAQNLHADHCVDKEQQHDQHRHVWECLKSERLTAVAGKSLPCTPLSCRVQD